MMMMSPRMIQMGQKHEFEGGEEDNDDDEPEDDSDCDRNMSLCGLSP